MGAFGVIAATRAVGPSAAKTNTNTNTRSVATKSPPKVAGVGKKKALKPVVAAAKKNNASKIKASTTKKKSGVGKKKQVAKKRPLKSSVKAKAKPEPKKIALKKKQRKRIVTTTSAAAARVANSGKDPALAITSSFKPKKNGNKQPLFPGLQSTPKKGVSVFARTNKTSRDDSAKKANNVVAAAGAKRSGAIDDSSALNPISFGLRVVQSEKGKEAASVLVDGGLKMVAAILEEGKNTKVVVPRGFDSGTGALKKPKIVNVGPKQLLDASVFAGSEFLDVAKSAYDRFYVGGKGKEQVRVTRTSAKVDAKTGRVLAPVKENYFIKVGGKRVLVNRPLR